MERERNVEKYLREQIEKRKGLCLKLTSPGQDGMPDRIVALPGGRVCFVELKTGAGVLSPVQRYQLKRLMDLGLTCSVIRSKKGVEVYLRDIDEWVTDCYAYDADGAVTDLEEEL